MKKKMFMIVALFMATCGCKQANPQVSSSVEINGITIQSAGNVREMKVGETLQLTAIVYPENASQEITWTSNDEQKASVSENGLVSALKVGNVNIIATSKVSLTISQSFSLIIKEKEAVLPTSVAITAPQTSLKVGEKMTLSATVYPEDANQNVEWSSDDEKVATVKRGEVSAIAEGVVTITAKVAEDSTLSDSVKLTISKADDTPTKQWEVMEFTSHETFMSCENETAIKVKGVVTHAVFNNNTVTYYMQNGNDGYYIYQQNASLYPIEKGKSYEIGGFKKYYRGAHEIVNVEYYKALPEDLTYNVIDLTDKNPSSKEEMQPYHAAYVSGVAVLSKTPEVAEKAYSVNVTINNNKTVLRIDPANMPNEEFLSINNSLSNLSEGASIEFKGIMSAFGYGTPSNQIQIMSKNDLKFPEIPLEQLVASAVKTIQVPAMVYAEETTLELPKSVAKNEDIQIAWESNNALINVNTGIVTHEASDVIVTLKATFTHISDASIHLEKEYFVNVFGTNMQKEVLASLDLDDAEKAGQYGISTSKSGYAEGIVSLGNPKYNWLLNNALIACDTNDHYEGNFAIRAKAGNSHDSTGRVELQHDGEFNYVQFKAAVYGNDSKGIQVGVEYSLDAGTTWLDSNFIVSVDSSSLQLYRIPLPTGLKRIAIYVVENTGNRINIDSIELLK